MADKKTLFQPPDESRVVELAGVPLASFTRRALALAVDIAVAGVAFLLIVVGGGSLALKLGIFTLQEDVLLPLTFFKNWYSVIWFVLYFTLNVYVTNGSTVGKKLCRIRIVSLVHEHIGFWHAFERALGYGASMLEAGFGFFQYFLRPDRRTIHDRIAETIVVEEPRKTKK